MNRHLLCAWAAGLILLTGCAASRPQQADGSDSAAQSAQEQRPPYQFGVGYSGTGYTSAFQQWRDLVLEDTQGNLELVLYGENVLGEGDSMVKAAQQGTLSIAAYLHHPSDRYFGHSSLFSGILPALPGL